MKKLWFIFLVPFIFLGTVSDTANAAKVYHSTPKALRGYYRTKMKKIHTINHSYYWSFKTLHIKAKTIQFDYGTGTDAYIIHNLYHANDGKNKFLVGGNYVPMGGESPLYYAYFIKKNKKLKVVYYNDSLTKVTGHETYYKFSGRASKVKNYPYS